MMALKRRGDYKFSDKALELKSERSESEVSCTPVWMYEIGDAMADVASTDELPDGYATSVGYGERFRNSEYLPLFSCYPLVPFLIILGCLLTLGGIAYAVYCWRSGRTLNRDRNCKISKENVKCFYMNYILVLAICIILIFANVIMLIANKNIVETKVERALQLKLAHRSIEELDNNAPTGNFEDSLNIFDQLSTKLLRAIEIKAQPYLGEISQIRNVQDSMLYKDDIKELLDTFAHANGYMLHFLDSWRYYDTNATKFAHTVATMDSRRAVRELRRVRADFSNVVYKVIQQNRAFYNYYQKLENVPKNEAANYESESDKKLLFSNTMNIHMQNVEDKLEKLGIKLHERTTRMKDTIDSLQNASEGAGYIEFPATLLGFGYFICVVMLLIVFLSLSFMPLWLYAKYCTRLASLRCILPLITIALIFAFYLIFVLATMYYILYGMVAKDGVCEGKRAMPLFRSNLIDDFLNNSNIYDANSAANYDKDTAEIEKVLKEIENVSKLREIRVVTSQPANIFEAFHVNKTIIQDIYVEMLKVSVYAPKNIETFGQIWQAHRLSTNKILQQLNCTHAIGHTMATSLHGQVAREMDRLYRATWRIEAMLQDTPKQMKTKSGYETAAKSSAMLDTNNDLISIFNAERAQLRASLYSAKSRQFEDLKPIAQLYKDLTTPSCECMVRSMNLFWFGAIVSVFTLLLLLALLLWLEEMLSRTCLLSTKESRRGRSARKTRGRSRTRSTSRPGTTHSSHSRTSHSTGNYTPHSTRNGTPCSSRPNTPYSSHADTPYSTRSNTPHTSRATPHTSRARAHSSHRGTPYSSQRTSPHTSPPRRASSHTFKHTTPYSKYARSPERTPTRGTSLAQKLPPIYDPYLNDYNSANIEQDPLVDRFTERLSRRDVLPRHQQRKHHYPSLGHRDMKDFLTYEPYPELSNVTHQTQQPTIVAPEQSYKEPKSIWKNDAYRYPGFAGSDMSTNKSNDIPRSISKVLERRGRSHSRAKHEPSTNNDEQPRTSGINAQIAPLPPGKVGIVLCPCGCGKPSKIYGTKGDIERIRQAGRICIAKRGEHLKNKHLRPLASIVKFHSDEPDEDNV